MLVLGACGNDEPAASSPIDSVGSQPGLRAPSPIEITSGGGSGGTESAVAADALGADKMMAPGYWISEYVFGDGMPALPTNDTGYVFDASGEVTAEQVVQLAAALGVAGDPVAVDPDAYGFWRVGPEDGSAPSLFVSNDAQQTWNYNSAWQDASAGVACAVSVDSNGVESEDCPEPEPPVGVPTEQEARQRAEQILAALGEDVSALEVEAYGDEWFASVTFRTSVSYGAGADDQVALREWSFGFGANGVLQYASGWLGHAEQVGPYPLIDLDAALARLNAGGYGYGGIGVADIAIAEPAPLDPGSAPTQLSNPPSTFRRAASSRCPSTPCRSSRSPNPRAES